MSEEIQKMGFGSINDTDESLKSKSGGGKFGLNTGFITKVAYIADAGADGTPGDAVDIIAQTGEKEFRRRMFDVTRVYGKNGELTDTNSPEYIKKYNEELTQTLAVIIHAVKTLGVTQAQIDAALAVPPANFADWAKIITSLVAPGYEKRPVDFFLEYQWTIKGENDRTYLEIPKNMKGGRFLAPHVAPVGKWNEQKSWTTKNAEGVTTTHAGLAYVDDMGNVHPFTRDVNYMESNKAIQQVEGQSVPTATTGSAPAASTW